jgi:hypothetical protein
MELAVQLRVLDDRVGFNEYLKRSGDYTLGHVVQIRLKGSFPRI